MASKRFVQHVLAAETPALTAGVTYVTVFLSYSLTAWQLY